MKNPYTEIFRAPNGDEFYCMPHFFKNEIFVAVNNWGPLTGLSATHIILNGENLSLDIDHERGFYVWRENVR